MTMVASVAKRIPRGVRLNNPGHLERRPGVRWQGQADDQSGDPRFVVFEEAKWGIRAIARVLISYQDKHGLDTVRGIVNRWAPPSENDTAGYVAAVARRTGLDPDERFDVYDWRTMKALVLAIIRQECGQQPYDDATIDAGLIAAGLQPPPHKTRPALGASLTAAASAAVAAASGVIDALPAAKEAHDQAVTAAGPLLQLVPWLPPVLGLVAFAAVLAVAARNLKLSKLAGG